MAQRTKVTVNQYAIRQQFLPGGQIHRYSTKVRDDVLFEATRKAPKRTGDLRAGMRADRIGTNGNNNRISVWNATRYAGYVEHGSPGTIKFIRLYGNDPRAPARYQWTVGIIRPGVEGFKGKFFMRRGLKSGLRMNGLHARGIT